MAKRIIRPAIRTVDEETGEVIITPEQSIEEATPQEIASAMAIGQSVYFKTPWNHDTDRESLASGLACQDKTRTQQHLAAEQDINNILRRFADGAIVYGQPGAPQYRDIEELADLQDVIVTGHQVDEAWKALPAAARNILRDPGTFVDYVEHCLETGDLDPLRELGLANPKPPEKAIEPPPAPPPGGTPAPRAGDKGTDPVPKE